MPAVRAYIGFSGQCQEAMRFYQQCLGGELSFMTVAQTPMAAKMPPEKQHEIMHATLTCGNLMFAASDRLKPEELVRNGNIVLLLECDTEAEIDTYFAALSEGGQVTVPLEESFWGAKFGQLIDRYGVSWMLNHYRTPPH